MHNVAEPSFHHRRTTMTVRNIAWVMVLSIVLAELHPAAGQGSLPRGDECVGVRWTPPRALRVGAYTAFLERPAIVPLLGRSLLLGPRAFATDSAGHPANPLMSPGAHYTEGFDELPMGVLADERGSWDWVTFPSRIRSMPWFPRAALDSSGTAHVVWASSDSAVDEIPPSAPSIWYARFDGRRWTEPERLATGHRYYWSSATVSPLIVRGRTLHFVVSTSGEGLTYFHATGGRWMAQHVGIPIVYNGYPALAVLGSGKLVLLAQGPQRRGREGWSESGVFISRSDDGGLTWTTPALISSGDAEPAYDFQLLESHGRLYALWFQQTDSLGRPALAPNLSNSPGRIYVAESADAGATWRQLAPTALLQNADGLQAMVGDDGVLIVTLADRVAEDILLTTWKGAWRPFARIPAAPNPSHPTLGRGDAQRPVLTWGTRRPHGWVTTMITSLTPCT
jgi:hypothetical protein